MHLAKPQPRSIDDVAATIFEFERYSPDGEIPIGTIGGPDADRAPVVERSIKEPHRGGDGDY